MKQRLFSIVYVLIFFLQLTISPIEGLEPSSYINNNVFLYLEIESPKLSIPKLKQLFYSLMNRKKADSEWKAFEDMFVEDYGINLLSVENINSYGFSATSPVGIAMRYVPRKTKTNTIYQRYLTLILPTDDSQKSYNYFFKKYIPGESNNINSQEIPISKEIEKDKLLLLNIQKLPLYVLKNSEVLIVSEDFEYIKNLNSPYTKSINENINFQLFKSYLKGNKNYTDQIGFFFINAENSDFPFRQNPRLILDNVLMDNKVIQEMAMNSKYFGGAIRVNSGSIQVSMDYFFPEHYLDDKNYFLGKFLDFTNQSYFPDNMQSIPFSYVKFQSNFAATVGEPAIDSMTSRKNIGKFLAGLLDTNSIEIPPDMEFLFKDNIAFHIQEIPSFKFLNKIYLWKGYLCVNYNPEYFQTFQKFMDNLIQESLDNKKSFAIKYLEIQDRKIWDFTLKKFIKKYDKKKDEVITEEKIYKFYISADKQQIVLTHDSDFLARKPASGFMPVISRVDPGNPGQNQVVFAYIDMKKLLKYVEEGSLALPLKNYFSYFEKGKSLIFKVNRSDSILSEELNLKIDR